MKKAHRPRRGFLGVRTEQEESSNFNPTPLNPNSTNTSVNQKDVTNTSLANKSCLEGENKGSSVVLNQALVQRNTKVDDSALGINPPSEQSNNLFFQEEVESSAEGINSYDSSIPKEEISQVTDSSTPTQDLPRNEKGSAKNPEAYQLWQPEKLEVEEINPVRLRERLASLSQRFAMPKPIKERKQPTDPIEQLNEWLAEPVLRNTAMSKIMQSDFLSVEFDSEGIPIRVIKIRGEEDQTG